SRGQNWIELIVDHSAEPSQFFIFFLLTLLVRFTMSAMFRSLAAVTQTVSQALAMAGVLVLAIVIYTGYTIPRSYMHPWFKWLTWINPLSYAFEALMVNEFHGRNFTCASFIPTDPDFSTTAFICSAVGAVTGQQTVSGDAYVQTSFGYRYTHLWRNFGIMVSFWLFFLATYLVASEMSSPALSSIEALLFLQRSKETDDHEVAQLVGRRNQRPSNSSSGENTQGIRSGGVVHAPSQHSIFSWHALIYDVQIKKQPRRLLDHVSGWVKPGTLTVLMGVSGAGKTTLLDVLAQRISIHGVMLVDGKPLKPSFQRNAGYVQQQDVHLETSTVREALRFSAILRQSKQTPLEEKYAYVEYIIQMLDMTDFSEAIVGIPGQGLNITQRKLLTIGVELAAKPEVLIFLDEPTSGLDSQSAWVIVALLRKLADSGQAILATIHQPSPILFLEFDRLLFLAKGGRTVYFGDIGPNADTLIGYFERQGGRSCRMTENPAEYILEQVTVGANRTGEKDWPALWNMSDECTDTRAELARLQLEVGISGNGASNEADHDEFAVSFSTQVFYTTSRVFQQYWRTPSYIYGKFLLGVASAFFVGFSFFNADSSIQGLQNVVFSIFMLTSILSTLVQQIMPRFVSQRSLYEIRERPSKVYSWAAFILANTIVEFLYQIALGILVYACYYYPVLGVQSSERQVLILISTLQIFVFASTFAHMVIVALPDAQTAGAVATLLFSMTMIFNGVFQPPQALPDFWIFMYRISPLTYIVGAVAGTGLHGRTVRCSTAEMRTFDPPAGQNCGGYLSTYLIDAAGVLMNPEAEESCQYCPLKTADQFLGVSAIKWSQRWRNVGIVFAFIFFNIAATFGLYYMFKVRRWRVSERLAKIKEWVCLFFAMWFGQAV
ncbi:putative ABC multidrug transporter, partial [Aureobasidium pullulans]